jgi:group I intron endonuclease
MGQSGVYKIVNLINGKVYVGSTADLGNRKRGHFWRLKHGKHLKRFQDDYDKYGADNFIFVIIETLSDHLQLLEREQFYIDLYDASNEQYGYNRSSSSKNCSGIKHTEETRRKMGMARLGEKHWNYGGHRSLETKQKISKSRTGKYAGENSPMYGKHFTDKARNKLSESRKGKYFGEYSPVAISVINLDTNKVYPTLTEAAKLCNVNINSLCAVCRGKRKTTGGYRWMYYNDYLKLGQRKDG